LTVKVDDHRVSAELVSQFHQYPPKSKGKIYLPKETNMQSIFHWCKSLLLTS